MSVLSQTHQEMLATYRNFPAQVEAALADLSEIDLDLTKGEGWSIRQVVHHLANGQMMFSMCVKAMLGFEDVALPFNWYMELTQDEWSAVWAFDRRPLGPALAALHSSVDDLADLLAHLPDEVWGRTGHITFRGQSEPAHLPIEWVIGMLPQHANGHIQDDILAIRKLHGK